MSATHGMRHVYVVPACRECRDHPVAVARYFDEVEGVVEHMNVCEEHAEFVASVYEGVDSLA